MKIIKDNTIYIQAKDLKRLKESNTIVSKSLLFLMHLLFNSYIDYNDEDFILFNEGDVNLDGIDWIINFDDIKDNTEEELTNTCNSLINQRNIIADKYNSLSIKDRVKNLKLLNQTRNLEYQINGYKDILDIKNGTKKLKLPEGIEYPDGFIKENKMKKLINKIKK